MGGKINLYLDIVSPFAYIAYYLTRTSPAFTNSSIQITYTPILLGGLMQATGNTPPINIKNKDVWTGKERLRWQKAFKIPMSETMPNPFPQPTVTTQRALCYISLHDPANLTKAFDALFKAFWVDAKKIGDVSVIAAALEPVFGKEGVAKVMEGIKSDEVKGLLKKNTEKAFADGAFGLPWFVVENEKGEKEGFWGVDHIGQVLDHLGVQARGQGGFKALL